MILYLCFALMIIISLAWLIKFIYRPLKNNDFNSNSSNIALSKQKLLELEQDVTQNLISKKQFAQAKEDIINNLTVELNQLNHNYKKQNNRWLVVFLLIALPITTLGVYQYLAPSHLDSTIKYQLHISNLRSTVANLNHHLQNHTDDFKSWQKLGLTYFELNQLKNSVNAYQKSYQINPKNIELLIEYASKLMVINNNKFTDKSIRLVNEALKIDKNNPNALYLAGLFAISVKNFKLAKILWNHALSVLPNNI